MIFSDLLGPFLGGALLGIASLMLLLLNGRIAGISGIFGGFLHLKPNDTGWRAVFLAGLLAGGLILLLLWPDSVTATTQAGALQIIMAGLLVGFGSRMASGCTSGHGICGLGRMSRRSIAAVASFMATGFFSASVLSHLFT